MAGFLPGEKRPDGAKRREPVFGGGSFAWSGHCGTQAEQARRDRARESWPAFGAPPWAPFASPLGIGSITSEPVRRKASVTGSIGRGASSGVAGGLTVSNAWDPAEREADAMAARALASPHGEAPPARTGSTEAGQGHGRVQRLCATCEQSEMRDGCDGRSGQEPGPEAETERLRRRGAAAEAPAITPAIASRVEALRGQGQPLPEKERHFFEERFGYDLTPVRVHDDRRAAETARSLQADAFTVRNDVAFATGRYQPGSDSGRRLLAHELAHVIQQGHATPLASPAQAFTTSTASAMPAAGPARIARRAEQNVEPTPVASPATSAAPRSDATSAPAAGAGGLVVEDDAQTLLTGQERKSAFLTELRLEVCAAADQALARVGRDTRGCPYIERWLGHYAGRPATHVERAIRKLVPGAGPVRSAHDYVPLVAARITTGVEAWVKTGTIPSDIPDELRAELPGGGAGGVGGAIAGAVSSVVGAVGGALSAIGHLLFKEGPAGAHAGADRAALGARLGAGRPLEGGTRARMEAALGSGLGDVQIHDDPHAASLAADLGARAFTLGRHVAFAEGNHRPGTPVGDALLAHELAHVVQQSGASGGEGRHAMADAAPGPALEQEADRAAMDAVFQLHLPESRGPHAARARGGRRVTSGRAGLRLQRCAGPAAAINPSTLPQQPSTPDQLVALAHNPSIPVEQRGIQLMLAMLATFYRAEIDKFSDVKWESDLKGLRTDCPDQTSPTTACTLVVGREYVENTNPVQLSRRVIQLGHELQHVDQHRTPGMAGAARSDLREFLAGYWASTAPNPPGLQPMQHSGRIRLIDGAIRHYNCLTPEEQAANRDKYDQLVALRASELTKSGGSKLRPIPPAPPTECGGDDSI